MSGCSRRLDNKWQPIFYLTTPLKFGSNIIRLMKYILLLALPPNTHILSKLLFTVCAAILCSNKLFFWHQNKVGFGSWKRQPMRRVQKAPSTFAWGDAKTEIMGSVLWAQTGFQRILVKDKLKMTSGDKCKERRKLVSLAFCPAPLIWWRLAGGNGGWVGMGCGTKDGKEKVDN